MRSLHVILVHHSVVHGGVYFRMAEQLLHLFDRHPLINGMSRQRTTELMRMHTRNTGFLAEVS